MKKIAIALVASLLMLMIACGADEVPPENQNAPENVAPAMPV